MTNSAVMALNHSTNKWEAIYNGKVLCQRNKKEQVVYAIQNSAKYCPKAFQFGITTVVELGQARPIGSDEQAVPVTAIVNINSEFAINERFMIMEDYVDMVAKGEIPSALITGEGGLGKTHTVMVTLKKNGLENIAKFDVDQKVDGKKGYLVIKGNSTAKALFRTLYENRSQILVFDDCDSVLKDPVAVNLLKAALDSYEERIITWNAEASFGGGDDELPKSFEFTGGVIFISNMSKDKIPQAIKSRAMSADVSMTRAEVVERMRTIMKSPEFMEEFDMEMKTEAMDFVADNAFNPMVKELNLRSLMNVIKCRAAKPGTWKRLALYNMVAA